MYTKLLGLPKNYILYLFRLPIGRMSELPARTSLPSLLSDADLDEQLQKLMQEKKDREEARENAKKIEGKTPELLYWNAPSYEILAELHKKYALPAFDFGIILHRAIEDKDLIFSIKLVLSGLIPDLYLELCGHIRTSNRELLLKVFEICVEQNDLDRLILLLQFSKLSFANKHNLQIKKDFAIPNKITDFEKQRIQLLISENNQKRITGEENCNINESIKHSMSYILPLLVKSTSDNIAKYILSVHSFGYGRQDVDNLKPLVQLWIREKNIEMIKYSMSLQNIKYADYSNGGPHDYIKGFGQEYLSQNAQVFLNYDETYYCTIASIFDVKCPNLTIDSNNINVVPLHILIEIMKDLSNQIEGQRTYEDSFYNSVRRMKSEIQRLTYLAHKAGRADLIEYLLELRIPNN